MNFFKTLFLPISTALLLGACAEPTIKEAHGFNLNFSDAKATMKADGSMDVSLYNADQKQVDSVAYFIDDVRFAASTDGNASITIADGKVGTRKILARVYSGEDRFVTQKSITVLAANPPKGYSYEILETYPHDIKAFTQGIEFVGDTLYESTGQYGQSTLRKVNYQTGEVLNSVALPGNQFGEGLTVKDNKIYQLTWQRGIGLIYDQNSMKKQGFFNYGNSLQGWGLCNDGEKIYKSDGSSRIWILNPETLMEEDYIEVYTHSAKIDNINELEFINGKIYANVWQRDAIAIINPETGVVEGVINTSSLKEQVTQYAQAEDENVLNGIAYKGEENILYLTGKRWEKLFKVAIAEVQ
ncbi:glutaminyl-peptide cyclotransferase [Gilvibacter sp.]|uniref:glutaminyl-peptide cyclotransferase n=1 Tax=Gilvibacter sp. TaxID=2729997 RepID=UPI0025C2EE4F|nr:glutaminyl-peptide cyclotransferase [Gilvibacter sp.]NQX76130.1 glutaminyl-peptide cyclotransferase [Gilvibacter sp.]